MRYGKSPRHVANLGRRERFSPRRSCPTQRVFERGVVLADDLYPVLKALTTKHQRYLIATNAERLVTKPKLKNNDQRLRRLAVVLGPNGVAPYRDAYLHRASRFVTLFETASKGSNQGQVTAARIEHAIKKRFPNWQTERPVDHLVLDAPPVFNKWRSYQMVRFRSTSSRFRRNDKCPGARGT